MSRLRTTVLIATVALASTFGLVPAAFAASVSIQPGDWQFKRNAVTTTFKGRGYITRINDATASQKHVSMVALSKTSGGPTIAKVDKWVRANHGKPARVCAVMRARAGSVQGSLAVNGVHKGTQSSGGGYKSRTFRVSTAWTRTCLDFTVASSKYYYGNADVWVQNWESADTRDLYLDYVTLATR